MRRLMLVALLSLMTALPVLSPATVYAAQTTAPVPQTNGGGVEKSSHRLLAVGAGAIVGIVVFNMLTYPLGSVPFVAAPLEATPVDIALGSRVLATVVAGTGALIANYLYGPGE